MAKLPECQFIKITIDGKEIKGASEEELYKGWMEGFAPTGLQAYSGVDGASFNSVTMSLLITKETSALYETYLKRGHKEIDVTIVVRSSNKFGSQYESIRTEYRDCNLEYMVVETVDGRLFLNTSITVDGSVQVTMQVPNSTDTGLDKIGPIIYDIAAKTLK
ncbi:hypothetical protein ACNSO7_25450 [Yersinia enterocolitica]|uniref:hypothetical protein n=1 Tax=Yersinia enterocolitica TaxID=630 RepID=UPI003AB82520